MKERDHLPYKNAHKYNPHLQSTAEMYGLMIWGQENLNHLLLLSQKLEIILNFKVTFIQVFLLFSSEKQRERERESTLKWVPPFAASLSSGQVQAVRARAIRRIQASHAGGTGSYLCAIFCHLPRHSCRPCIRSSLDSVAIQYWMLVRQVAA